MKILHSLDSRVIMSGGLTQLIISYPVFFCLSWCNFFSCSYTLSVLQYFLWIEFCIPVIPSVCSPVLLCLIEIWVWSTTFAHLVFTDAHRTGLWDCRDCQYRQQKHTQVECMLIIQTHQVLVATSLDPYMMMQKDKDKQKKKQGVKKLKGVNKKPWTKKGVTLWVCACVTHIAWSSLASCQFTTTRVTTATLPAYQSARSPQAPLGSGGRFITYANNMTLSWKGPL